MLGRDKSRVGSYRFYARHALTIIVVLLIAACSGGGCSSGCSSCGMTTLERPISTVNTIQNAGALRLTRSGLDFLGTNAPTLAGSLLGSSSATPGEFQYPLALGGSSVDGINLAFCSSGPNATSNPEECELDVGLNIPASSAFPNGVMATFHVDAVNPDSITVTGTLPIRLEDLPVTGSYSGIITFGQTVSITLHVGIGADASCNDSTGQPNEPQYAMVPVTVTLPLIADTIVPRVGFTKIDAANIAVNVGVTSSDVEVCANCNLGPFDLSSICDGLFNGIIDLAFSAVNSTLQGDIKSAVQAELCTKPAAGGVCPAGSALDTGSGNCDYTAQPGTCLPIGLGIEGGLNLGSLLQSISYGASSNLDVALAGGGNMIPANVPTIPYTSPGFPAQGTAGTSNTPNGVTLGLIGALVPDPISSCVPLATNPPPQNIPIPTEMEQNVETPWAATDPPGPQFGAALAGRFLNYALGSIYNSGALCLGLTTDSFAQLDSGLLSLLAPSVKDLTFEQTSAAAAVITRPQQPPTVVIGDGTDPNTDPLLMLTLKQFALDFYVFSDSRFVRIFTYTADLQIPINISTAVTASNPDGELAPTLGNVIATNDSVTNSELLTDSPTKIASGLTPLLGTIVSQVAGSINPISLASLTASLGLSVTIPADGIRKLTTMSAAGTDDFVALFGNLAVGPTPQIKQKPQAKLVSKEVHAEAMALTTYDATKLPALHMTFGTETVGSNPVEYTYWIDKGLRSPWSTDTTVTIQNQTLFLQGHHYLYVSAREVGSPSSESDVPAVVPFTIDVLPPMMTLTSTATGATLTAWDYVSDQAHLEGRTRITDPAGNTGPWSDWQPLADLATLPAPGESSSLGAEVRDEEGNVSSSEVALIRGQNDVPAAAGACGCSTPGTNTGLGGASSLLLLFFGLGGIVVLRRVRRTHARAASSPLEQRRQPGRAKRAQFAAAAALGVGVVVGSMSQGCSCNGSGSTVTDGGIPDSGADGEKKHPKPDGDKTNEAGMTGCGTNCNQPCLPALPEGIIGAYTSIAKASDGTVWVAGYDDSSVAQAYMGLYGDLVVGKYDSTKSQVEWATADGVPDAGGMCPLYDPTGWRKGQTASGPDVGLWTSIQLDANDHPIVSYYDTTNAALKFASSPDGVKWTSYAVMQATGKDIGRYSKMLVVNGVPVVAFLIMEAGDSGKLRSKVELATGKVATPKSASDWTFEDAAVDDDGPCRTAFCAAPSVCITETGTCSPPSTGCGGGGGDAGDAAPSSATCVAPQVCVGGFDAGPSCGTPMASSYIDIYPNAFGDYIAMAPTTTTSNGVGIVVYDRIHGALVQVAKMNGTWIETVLDSETGARAPSSPPDGGITPAETGDVGVGASLFITPSGDWHISYVNGTVEALQYIMVPGGTQQPGVPEVVDNGTMLAGAPYPDGVHIIGDDSSIQVDSVGNVSISYQDATAGTLHVATGMLELGGGGGHNWAVLAASQPNKFAGYFSHSIAGNNSSFANFWRTADPGTGDMNGNVSFTSP